MKKRTRIILWIGGILIVLLILGIIKYQTSETDCFDILEISHYKTLQENLVGNENIEKAERCGCFDDRGLLVDVPKIRRLIC